MIDLCWMRLNITSIMKDLSYKYLTVLQGHLHTIGQQRVFGEDRESREMCGLGRRSNTVRRCNIFRRCGGGVRRYTVIRRFMGIRS